jgi:hypothetical protein
MSAELIVSNKRKMVQRRHFAQFSPIGEKLIFIDNFRTLISKGLIKCLNNGEY